MYYSPSKQIVYINDVNLALDYLSDLEQDDLVSVDTETAGWQYGLTKLCLVQLTGSKSPYTIVFDVLAFDDPASLLKNVIENEKVLKIAHNATFELRSLETIGLFLRNVEDTFELAKRLRPHLPSFRLSTLCEHFLGKKLDKSYQTSNWMQRPLSEAQIAYAAADAEVTLNIFFILKEIEQSLSKRLEGDLPQLLITYKDVLIKRNELLKPIIEELCEADYLLEALRARIKEELPKVGGEIDTDFAYAKLQEVKKTEVSIEKLRSRYPNIADEVIELYVRREKLKAALKELGEPASSINDLLVETGRSYRLQLEIKDL